MTVRRISEVQDARPQQEESAGRGWALRVLYWIAVVAVSLALVYVLITWFESLDESSLDSAAQSIWFA